MDMSHAIDRESPTYDIFVTALRNTHAIEQQALQIMERQVERITDYPEMVAALRSHIEETHEQRRRLEEALQMYDESPSALKEGVLGLVGNMAALAHAPAQDDVIKNNLANHAFENFEVAAYDALLVMARAAGHTNTQPFEQSLGEEERMAKRVRQMLPEITRKYIALTAAADTSTR